MIHLIKLSSHLQRPVFRVPGTRGGSMVSEADLAALVEQEAYQRPGAVRSWAGAQQKRMRQLPVSLASFAKRMLAILRRALAVAVAWVEAEALASEDDFLAREQVAGGVS